MRLSRDPTARRRLGALVLGALAALSAGLVVGTSGEDSKRGAAGREAGELSRLTLRQQVGQTSISSFDGTRLPAYLRRRLRAGETAGVVLFGRNVASRVQLRALTRDIQRAAGGRALIATDQEGGPIRSLAFAGPAAAQPAQGAPEQVKAAARGAARELRAVGVNVNLAPVGDVSTDPGSVMAGRAFAGAPGAVAARVDAAVEGWGAGGVAPTVKHFPGFGAARVNTDDLPVTIYASRAALETDDLPPFRAAIGAGAPLIMASHALYPALDDRLIASQSAPILRDLLRGRLGFRGAVVTDSIEAEAVLRRGTIDEASERSLSAGADLVLMTGSATWKIAFPRLLAQARRSPAFRARVRRAAARVLRLRRALGLSPRRPPAPRRAP